MQQALELNSETVSIATSLWDQYVNRRSQEALKDRLQFQLAGIASLYIAVKNYESVELNVATLTKLCQGFFEESDILSTEEDILSALEWRIVTPTPMKLVRIFIHRRSLNGLLISKVTTTKPGITSKTDTDSHPQTVAIGQSSYRMSPIIEDDHYFSDISGSDDDENEQKTDKQSNTEDFSYQCEEAVTEIEGRRQCHNKVGKWMEVNAFPRPHQISTLLR